MKWIRWQGLIAFIVIVGAGAAFWLLMVDSLVERAMESAGSSAMGARVDIRNVDLSLLPLGLTITGLEITDPDEPMTNVIEAERIAFLMDSGRLLQGKVIIDEMSVEGIRLGTARKTSGAMAPKKEKDAKPKPGDGDSASGIGMDGFSIPDAGDILGREELQTLSIVETAESSIKQKEAEWDARLKTLPDANKVKELESRYKALEKKYKGSTSDKLAAIKEAEALKKEIKAARDSLKAASRDIEADYNNLRTVINRALAAPEQDIKRLKDKYQLSAKGIRNASALLMGPSINKYISKAISIYERLRPFMQSGKADETKPIRGKGVNVTFREFNPAPAFWARTIRASAETSQGPIKGTLNDLSSDQGVTGRPATFEFASKGLKKTKSMQISGAIDHRRTEAPDDTLNISIEERQVENLKLSASGSLPVTIKDGKADLTVNARLAQRGTINARARLAIHSADIESSPDGDSKLLAALGRTISSMDAFSLYMKATGTIDDYDLSIASDLDETLKSASKDMLKQESDKFEAALRVAVKDRTSEKLSGLTSKLKGLEGQKASLGNQSGSLDALLNNVSGIKSSDKVEDKLKDKLKKLF